MPDIRKCAVCGKDFRCRPSANRSCCSRECKYQWHSRITTRPRVERFWEKVRKTDGCWLWTAYCNPAGYGHLSLGGRTRPVGAHRVSWEIHYGSIPEGMLVCHRCDNPRCVRPDHLFLGTKKDNNQDCIQKGRYPRRNWKRGESHHLSRLTEEQVIEIRHLAIGPGQYTAIGERFAVNRSTIKRIVQRKTWKHVP